MSASSSIKTVICNVCKRVKFVILNVSLHSVCNNGHRCRNKCTRKRVLRTCKVCVVPVHIRPLMSFPHTKSNRAHDKISKSKTNPGIVSADNHAVRNNFVDVFFWDRTDLTRNGLSLRPSLKSRTNKDYFLFISYGNLL